jgi:hypothetical protein
MPTKRGANPERAQSPSPRSGLVQQDGAGNPYERRSFALEITGWFVSQVRGA